MGLRLRGRRRGRTRERAGNSCLLDLDVVVLDVEGEVVALSRHTALIVGVERNYKVKGEGAKI